MTKSSEMTADMRELISGDEDALVSLVFQGRAITGTKGDLISMSSLDRDDGGIYSDDKTPATFVLADFPTTPLGTEVVMVDNEERRIASAKIDDFNVAVVLAFTSPNEQ